MSNNFTMRCVDLNDANASLYTKDKLYKVKEGSFTRDDGIEINNITDFHNWSCSSSSIWELVDEVTEPIECVKTETIDKVRAVFDILGFEPNERFRLVGRDPNELYYVTDNLMVYRENNLCELDIRHILMGTVEIVPEPTERDVEFMKAVQVVFGEEYREYHRDINNVLCVANMAHTQEFLLQSSRLEFIKNGEMYVFEGE